ncbi:roadblock/LC7 domain-containing protein [Streptomyces tsukubensis]|uniref:roadblock/LC7 domain-containing protein n=1 Tax=Streptomyces tsukubensis TaxID=83656 RepID=UPI0015C2F04A|nr:roadblock/LC7 domain-containing protein [Streptomyces tsukubensis]
MSAEADVLNELRRLRARVPQLDGALAASTDGLVLAQDTAAVEAEALAALTAAALGVALRMAEATGRGAFRELLVRGDHGYVATYAAGSSAVLTLLAGERVSVGRLHLEGRRSGARIGEIVDRALRRAEPGEPQREPRAQRPSRAEAPRNGPADPAGHGKDVAHSWPTPKRP